MIGFILIILFFAIIGGKYIIMLIMLLPLRYWMGREKSRSKICMPYGVTKYDNMNNKQTDVRKCKHIHNSSFF